MKLRQLLIIMLFVVMVISVSAQDTTEIRITGDFPPNEVELFEELIERFESENPDISVNFDQVPYSQILTALPLQLETGEGPDIAKVTGISSLSEFYLDMRPYLEDPDYWDENFGTTINLTNPDGLEELNAVFTDVTVTGPFINRTLFEQAGVPVPSDESSEVTWEEWAEAANAVADALDIPFPMAMDRSGHRFAGPAVSQGATYFNEDGYPAVDTDEGIRRMAELMIEWHADGTMPLDVWAGGDSYRDARAEFVNGQLVFYMTGNWQIGALTDQIGDAFDWEAIPNPCGPGACSGMPGGAVLAAIGATEHPEEVTRFMEFFASEPIYREWAERSFQIPQHNGIIAEGLNYDTSLMQTSRALDVFSAQTALLSPVTFELQAYLYGGVIFDSIRDRLTQALVGELSLDEALARAQQDIDLALEGTEEG